ncbi:M20/M25/M40 family metallo-hydrolase [Psychrobacillus sp. INOP01]|uniref:M20 family metallopeptidase n=1 Tax=Psychrobacillus sp. INOP01 TaxID=2829187 RepID=UPI001BAB9694|nr:M20/M25/M40 family metallo-hydrolase [Psychrobacillus sp. INOP01]QUG42844.1 M20/M25/M40 family metallo-hydrolase [Psychrobacillus sp. INOP01]
MIALLKDLVRMKSDSIDGANSALLFCESWLEERGITTTVLKHEDKLMLVAVIGDGDECMIWNGHVDVVPGNPEQFEPFVEGDLLYGRGTADMKAGVAAMMQAFYELSKEPKSLTKKIQLHIVTDEETDGQTSKFLVDQGYTGDFVICGEPTHLKIGLQAKGIIQFDVILKGKPSHGSRPWEGKNAIEQAFLFDQQLRTLSFLTASNEFYDYPSLNLAKIQAGERYNVVPDECIVSYDLRFVPGQDMQSIIEDITKLAQEFSNSEMKIQTTAPAVTTEAINPYIERIAHVTSQFIGKPAELFGQHGAADARFYAETGAGAIEFGPSGGDWHGEKEYVSISSTETFKNILVSLVKN